MYLIRYKVPTLMGILEKSEEKETLEEVTTRITELGTAGYTCRVFKELSVNVGVSVVDFNVEVKTYEAYKGGHTVGLGKD